MFAKWIQSYRDLPLLINQWANVVAGSCARGCSCARPSSSGRRGTPHTPTSGAEREAHTLLGVYRKFSEEWMAMPVITGVKTESEEFAGALRTYAIEALMQDNKALQAGTSHNLGQNFAKAFMSSIRRRPADSTSSGTRPGASRRG
jgi:prolyl-tRNA synthetase